MNLTPSTPAPRRILLCVSGLSPQIVTETLYALAVERSPAFVPDEIHLVTTTEGAERARLALLEGEDGHFLRLCADYGLDAAAIRFDETTLHVIPDAAGAALDDIRTEAHNAAAADHIAAVVRRLTAAADSEVHASIAGGRKTMGFFLGYAMSLFGRPCDRLSHVLVSAPFESHPEFFFPPRRPRVLFVRDRGNDTRPVRTSDAVVTLADIPFVRLRDHLDPQALSGATSYSETVRRAQASLGPAHLTLETEGRRVRCGSEIVRLTPMSFAWLAWFARRALVGLEPLHWTKAPVADFLAEYRAVQDALSGDYERVEALRMREGITKEFFEQRNTRLKKELEATLGRAPARPYLPQASGQRPLTCHGLALRSEQIRFGAIED